MSLRVEPTPRLAGRAVAVAVLVLVAIPLYLSLETSWRPLIVRLACALIVGLICLRVLRGVRRTVAVDTDTVSAFDMPPPVPVRPELDSRFLRLRDELTFSTRSQRYFEAILWPRLRELGGPDLPPPPARRRISGRGPSLAALEELIARMERRA